jgi:hypothetical protein
MNNLLRSHNLGQSALHPPAWRLSERLELEEINAGFHRLADRKIPQVLTV